MLRFRDLSIRCKLTLITMLTSSVALLLACAASAVYDLVTFRRTMMRDLETLAQIPVQTQPSRDESLIPPSPREIEYSFEGDHVRLFQPLVLDGGRIGTLYLQSSLQELEARLRRYTGIVGAVMAMACGVVGDPMRLRQGVDNLVSNAIKFTDRGEVFVRVESREERAREVELHFFVQDTGVGIPPDQQRVIFDAFSQADTSTTRKYSGTGLGLTICSRLVELMGGRAGLRAKWARVLPSSS